ncbi:hypothetical protein AYL99_09311 [Fonsecaea erecta]|uniref:Uncharacterized protein n=1 Tax=Fonsecaea erecta TaxID=1367422 RepID=A0A178Z8Y6_9EURO|nr:hypothetical protein AYL99_09311 [Fonsecaea erecta]OAP56132.1 hypothetical protein AYL99_09311 [Fonsecaea erecta]
MPWSVLASWDTEKDFLVTSTSNISAVIITLWASQSFSPSQPLSMVFGDYFLQLAEQVQHAKTQQWWHAVAPLYNLLLLCCLPYLSKFYTAHISKTQPLLSAPPSFKTSDPVLNSDTISPITAAEEEITGSDSVVKGGPTAQAQSHVGESINSQTLHDITEGEKRLTSGERMRSGPTATAQSILVQERNETSPASANEQHPTETLKRYRLEDYCG